MIDFKRSVKLRRIQRSDLEQLIKWRNNYQIFRWCRQSDVLSWEHHVRWFDNLLENESTISMYSIEISDDKKPLLVGVCGLTSIDRANQRAEFSLYVGPEFGGNDYGYEALMTLFYHAFWTLNLNSVWGETVGDNPAIKTFEKVGMVKEGERREFYYREGKFQNSHLYSVTRREFLEKHGNPT